MDLRIDTDGVARGVAGRRRRIRRGAGFLSAAGLLICAATPLAAAVPSDTAETKTSAVRAIEPGTMRPSIARAATGTIATGISEAGPELVVGLTRAAPAAAFTYGRHVWIVITTDERLSRLPPASAAAGRRFADLEVTQLHGGVALRMRRQAGRRLVATRQREAWHFTFASADKERRGPGLSAVRRVSTLAETVVALPALRGGTVHRLVDPVVGTTLLVTTTADPGLAVGAAYRSPAFRLLPTALGAAIEVRADGVTAEPGADGLQIRYRPQKVAPKTEPGRR